LMIRGYEVTNEGDLTTWAGSIVILRPASAHLSLAIVSSHALTDFSRLLT
jgi:hypothetical protein